MTLLKRNDQTLIEQDIDVVQGRPVVPAGGGRPDRPVPGPQPRRAANCRSVLHSLQSMFWHSSAVYAWRELTSDSMNTVLVLPGCTQHDAEC